MVRRPIACRQLCRALACVPVPHLITNVELLHSITLLHDLADKLVPADEVGRAFQVAAIEVQVTAA